MSERAGGPRRPGNYVYRRRLRLVELLPAVGVGIAAGLAGFYVARLFLQRTPMRREGTIPVVSARGRRGRRPLPERDTA